MGFGGIVAGSARVVVGVDNRDLHTGLAKSSHELDQFGRRATSTVGNFAKAFSGLALVGGAAGAGALFKSTVDAASDLSEQINKATVVFAGSERQILAWSQTTSSAIGVSRREALEAAGTFGNMLVPMGFARDRAAEMSRTFVELAADMASFNNASPEETLQALRSGLAGETEPLRRFGVFLNQARIEEEALRSGLVKQGQELTAAGKAQATYSIILKDTADTQGDFARTSDGLANQQRVLRARFEDLRAQLGANLLPTITRVIAKINDWIERLQENEQLQRDLKDAVDDVVGTIRAAAGAMDRVAKATGGWGETLKIVLALGVASKVAAMTRSFTALAGAEAAAAGGGAAGILGAAGAGRGLLAVLNRLKTIGPIAITVSLVLDSEDRNKILDFLKVGLGLKSFEELKEEAHPSGGGRTGSTGVVPDPRGRGGGLIPQRAVLARGADRPGVATKQLVLDFVSRIAEVGGQDRLVIGTGTRHSKHTTSGNVSQHWTGNAADIPAGGAELTALGQAALIAAGADPAWARRQEGGLYNIGGFQIIFNSNIGGNHWNHLHVGVRDGTEIPGAPAGREKPSTTSQDSKQDTKYGRDKKSRGGGGELIPPRLRLNLAKAELTAGTADDIAALTAVEQYLEQRIAKEKNVEKQTKLLQELKQTRDRIADLREGDKPDKGKGADELVPARLRLRLVQAEVSKGTEDDLRVLRQVEDYLEQRIAREKDTERKIRLLNELQSVRSQIAGLTDKDEPQVEDLIPRRLQLRLARAELTKTMQDDLSVLDEIVGHLERRIKREKDLDTRLALLRELQSARAQRASAAEGLREQVGVSPTQRAFDKAVEELIARRPSSTIGSGRVTPRPYDPATEERKQQIEGQLGPEERAKRAEAKQERHNQLGRILTPLAARRDEISGYWRELGAKLRAARARLKALNGALKRLRSVKPRLQDRRAIANHLNDIAATKQKIAELEDAIKLAEEAWHEIVDEMDSETQKVAEEDEQAALEAAPRETASGGGGGGGGGGGEGIGGGGGAPATDLTRLPPELRLRQAQAEGTKTTADDLALARETEAIFAGRLASAQDVETQIALTQQLNAVRAQIERLNEPLPPELRLRQAQSEATKTGADDLLIAREIEAIYARRLAANPDVEAQIVLTQQLTGIRSQIERLNETLLHETVTVRDENVLSFLTGLRNLREFQDNIYSPLRPLAGSTIHVENHFQASPDDPHVFSAGLAFELKALVG